MNKPMNKNQYREALDQLEITQLGAGRLLRIGSRTSRRWALGEGRIPFTAEALLKLMLKGKVKPRDLEKL